MSPTATSPIIKRRIAIRLIQGFSYEANAPHGDTDHVRIPQDHAIRDRTPRKRRPILAAAREIDLHFAVLIQVMAQGGLRPGEVMAVRRQDVSGAGARRRVAPRPNLEEGTEGGRRLVPEAARARLQLREQPPVAWR